MRRAYQQDKRKAKPSGSERHKQKDLPRPQIFQRPGDARARGNGTLGTQTPSAEVTCTSGNADENLPLA